MALQNRRLVEGASKGHSFLARLKQGRYGGYWVPTGVNTELDEGKFVLCKFYRALRILLFEQGLQTLKARAYALLAYPHRLTPVWCGSPCGPKRHGRQLCGFRQSDTPANGPLDAALVDLSMHGAMIKTG
jgi:hypothetical protein